jgi:hypothetical protein
MLNCANCYCDHLLIRRRQGLERLMIYLTGKRKYICVSCGNVFRAPDRRLSPRAEEGAVLPQAQREGLGA